MIPLGEWSCNICGPSPTSDSRWCDRGCGRDYNEMTWVPSDIRVLALNQPVASLWAMGEKRIETRGAPWPSTIPLPAWCLIHANVKRPLHLSKVGEWWVHSLYTEPESGPELRRLGSVHNGELVVDRCERRLAVPMPLGAIVGAVHVTDSLPIDRHALGARISDFPHDGPHPQQQGGLWITGVTNLTHGTPRRVEDQRPYGDFTSGRYGYLGDRFAQLAEPIPHKGKQGWSDRATPDLIAEFNKRMWGVHV